MKRNQIPVIDLFAGPGGLGEGFSAFSENGVSPFDVRLSIEKDGTACDTLRLRKFFRAFDEPPKEYISFTRGACERDEMYAAHPEEAEFARSRVWQAQLGKTTQALVYRRVRQAVAGSRNWVLLGGPPCQAYSIVGRSRMKSRSDFESDERHFLYREYLRIVANEQPTVFVMENVKGLLSATHGGAGIFERIRSDLQRPGKAARIARAHDVAYDLYTLASPKSLASTSSSDASFVVKAEEYGIPQTRHRVFIVGVRRGLNVTPERLSRRAAVNLFEILADLPHIRSRLSREDDSPSAWADAIHAVRSQPWFQSGSEGAFADVVKHARAAFAAQAWPTSAGGPYAGYTGRPHSYSRWYRDGAQPGITLHQSRAHMRSDLWRYFFCSCFAASRGRSPGMRDIPRELRPEHTNVSSAVDGTMFSDRFRVQQADDPGSTVTSHIAKDGHYYIHFDPTQCRSLTPREAARIQTFPDSYFFEGNKTEQFRQIGNAVPPLLAREIAAVVFNTLLSAGAKR